MMSPDVVQFDVYNARQLALLIVPPIFLGFATVAVGLRWYARSLRRINSLVEDIFCLAGFLMMFFVVGTIYVQVYLTGEGLSTAQVVSTGRPTVMLWWHKIQFALDVCWATSIAAIQLSLLNYYIRLFHARRIARVVCYTLMAMIVGWYILSLVAWILHCHPSCPRTPAESCNACSMQSQTACITIGLVHVAFDLCIMVIGIPAITYNPSSLSKKVSLPGLIILGLFCILCAIFRMDCIIPSFGADRTTDPISASWGRMLVSPLEIAVGAICCCVPNLSALRDGWRDKRIHTPHDCAIGLRRLKFRNRSTSSNLPIFVGETYGGVKTLVSLEDGVRPGRRQSFALQEIKITKEYMVDSKV